MITDYKNYSTELRKNLNEFGGSKMMLENLQSVCKDAMDGIGEENTFLDATFVVKRLSPIIHFLSSIEGV